MRPSEGNQKPWKTENAEQTGPRPIVSCPREETAFNARPLTEIPVGFEEGNVGSKVNSARRLRGNM